MTPDQLPSPQEILHQATQLLQLAGEYFLSACVWLELKLAAADFDPILVIPLAVLFFFLLRRPRWSRIHNKRRFGVFAKWTLASPFFLFAGYILADEILYWLPYQYTERLSEWTGIERSRPLEGVSRTAASNFNYPGAVKTIEGRRRSRYVIDADTLRLGDTRVRLNGIAAPESGHPLYDDGKRFVRRLLRQGRRVTCHLIGEQTHDREAGYCFLVRDGQKNRHPGGDRPGRICAGLRALFRPTVSAD